MIATATTATTIPMSMSGICPSTEYGMVELVDCMDVKFRFNVTEIVLAGLFAGFPTTVNGNSPGATLEQVAVEFAFPEGATVTSDGVGALPQER